MTTRQKILPPRPGGDDVKARVGDPARAWLFVTCFVTGAVILVLEVLGFRIFAPYFGSSVYVSGTLIGIVLAALSLGYVVGGALADRIPQAWVVYALISAAGTYLAGVYASYAWLLERLQGWGLVAGTISATLIIFGPPMTLLSMVSPCLIRLAIVQDRVGRVAGSIFALSTVGSITGSFVTTFVLIPELGSNLTLLGCVLTVLALGAAGLWQTRRTVLPAGLLLLGLLPQYTQGFPDLILRTESLYNTIMIRDWQGVRTMVLNNPNWRQSYEARPGEHMLATYREYFNLAPHLTEVQQILILGMSAGASLNELKHYFDVSIDAVDIDGEVIRLAKEYFGVEEDARTRLIAADARPFLAKETRRYDFIEIDLFHGGPELPFYVATQEFFELVRRRLTPRGLVMMNVLGRLHDGEDEMLRAVGSTLASVFPAVFVMPLDSNAILVATSWPADLAELRRGLDTVTNRDLRPFASNMRGKLSALHADGPVLTDDWPPVERMTRRLMQASH